jgi:ribosomal protein L29
MKRKKLKEMGLAELRKRVVELDAEIAKRSLDKMVNPPKNTNAISIMKKEYARILTKIREMELVGNGVINGK